MKSAKVKHYFHLMIKTTNFYTNPIEMYADNLKYNKK